MEDASRSDRKMWLFRLNRGTVSGLDVLAGLVSAVNDARTIFQPAGRHTEIAPPHSRFFPDGGKREGSARVIGRRVDRWADRGQVEGRTDRRTEGNCPLTDMVRVSR
jgi:hypothetical protein